MYVEDNDIKTLRLAKRKAYGACDKHSGHWDWGVFVAGIVPMAFFCFLISSIAYDIGLTKNIEPKIIYQYDTSGTLQTEQRIHSVCKDKSGKILLDQTMPLRSLPWTHTGFYSCTVNNE